jgi:hypothetical protein
MHIKAERYLNTLDRCLLIPFELRYPVQVISINNKPICQSPHCPATSNLVAFFYHPYFRTAIN